MKRRAFLRAGTYGAVLMGGAATVGWPLRGFAAHTGAGLPRTLVNVMLNGGLDWRLAIVPEPGYDPTYIQLFWAARRALYREPYPDYATMYRSEYQTVTDPASSVSFGIHNSCGWLAREFSSGHVAIIANTVGSQNRDHDHSVLIMDSGDLLVGPGDKDRDGWGGRLVEYAGGNVVPIAPSVSIMAYGSDPSNRLARVVHGKDMRNMAIPLADESFRTDHPRNNAKRALFAYYSARGAEIRSEKPAEWPYRKFFQHFDSIREFGARVQDQLSHHPLPSRLGRLRLADASFAQQCRNLYDCCQTADMLDLKVIGMTSLGFDTHADQYTALSVKLRDIFGIGGGLDSATAQIMTDMPQAADNITFLFGSDFGRQLIANGSRGTDHGTGTYAVLVGNQVRGGTYGDMFPLRESSPDPNDSQGRAPLELLGTDIAGLTSFERVYARACDWAVPGAGAVVFPGAAGSIIEHDSSNRPVDLSELFVA